MGATAESLLELNDDLRGGTILRGGTFIIESALSNGGFGIVYKAYNAAGKTYAIKEFFVEGFSRRGTDLSVQCPSEFHNEIRELRILFNEEGWWPGLMSHPNLMRVLDFFEENETGYIVLEYIEGADLQDIMAHNPEWLEPGQIVQIASRIASALAYLHSNGVVHGDIAPDNIIMRGAVDPVLIDFGSSLFNDGSEATRRPPNRLRAVKDGYSAPELYNRRLHPTDECDIYSFGATLYHMVSGTAPEPANKRLNQAEENEPLLRNADRFPALFLSSISKALCPRREERPTAKKIVQICEAIMR